MGLIDEYERIDLGRKLAQYKENAQNYIQHIRNRLDEMLVIRADNPADAAEIDALIGQLKGALQNIIDTY